MLLIKKETEQIGEGDAIDVLEDQEEMAFDPSQIKGLHHIGMIDARGGLGLARRPVEHWDGMLKGSRQAIVRKIQPISIHGQISLDIYFTLPDDPDGAVAVARVVVVGVTFITWLPRQS